MQPFKFSLSTLALAALLALPVVSQAQQYEFRRVNPGLNVQPAPAPTTTPTPPAPPPAPALTKVLSLSTSDIDFPGTVVGRQESRQVLLSNIGTGAVSVQAVEVSGSPAFSASSFCSGALAAGASCLTEVRFTPSVRGEASGQVSFVSDATAQLSPVTLSGTGEELLGTLTPATTAHFGDVTVNQTVSRTFSFVNTGTLPLTGVYASISGAGLVLNSQCGTAGAPVTLAVNAACQVVVSFTPTTAAPLADASLQVFSSATGSPSVQALTGAGVGVGVTNFGAYRGWSDGTFASSCKEYRTAATYAGATGDGVYRMRINGVDTDAYCDMTTDGGGWTMWYTTNAYYHLATAASNTTAYATNGYSRNLRHLPFREIMYVRHSDGAKDWFTRDTATNIVLNSLITGGTTLNVGGNTHGLWTGKGGAATGYKYQLTIGDNVWMQVGLMISGYNGCYKAPNSWCNDTSTNYYRINGEGNGTTNVGAYGGVAFRQNGHGNVASQLMSVGVR